MADSNGKDPILSGISRPDFRQADLQRIEQAFQPIWDMCGYSDAGPSFFAGGDGAMLQEFPKTLNYCYLTGLPFSRFAIQPMLALRVVRPVVRSEAEAKDVSDQNAVYRDLATIRKSRAEMARLLSLMEVTIEVGKLGEASTHLCRCISLLQQGSSDFQVAEGLTEQTLTSFQGFVDGGATALGYIQTWLPVLSGAETASSDTYNPLPALRNVGDVPPPLPETLMRNPMISIGDAGPLLLSDYAFFHLVCDGSARYRVAPSLARAGAAHCRDGREDFRLFQYRSPSAGLCMYDSVLPLAHGPLPPAALQMTLLRLTQAVGVMYRNDATLFRPWMLGHLLPRVVTQVTRYMVRNHGKLSAAEGERLLSLRVMLSRTALLAMPFCGASGKAAVADMRRRILRFSLARRQYGRSMGDLCDVITRMAMADVPFPYVREAFFRELLLRCVLRHPMREAASPLDVKRVLQAQCMPELRTVLCLMNVSSAQMLNAGARGMYHTTGGELPQKLRNKVVEAEAAIVARVNDLETVAMMLGIIPLDTDSFRAQRRVLAYVEWALRQTRPNQDGVIAAYADTADAADTADGDGVVAAAGAGDAEAAAAAAAAEARVEESLSSVAEVEALSVSVSEISVVEFFDRLDSASQAAEQQLAEGHVSTPSLPLPAECTTGDRVVLPRTTCIFCGAQYPSRRRLFEEHLYRCFPDLPNRSGSSFGNFRRHGEMMPPYCHAVEAAAAAAAGGGGYTLRCALPGCGVETSGRSAAVAQLRMDQHHKTYGVGYLSDWAHVPSGDIPEEEEEEAGDGAAAGDAGCAGESKGADAGARGSGGGSSGGSSGWVEECVVCMEDPLERAVSVMLLPCGHQCMCAPCAHSVRAAHGSCPLCRAAITSLLNVGEL